MRDQAFKVGGFTYKCRLMDGRSKPLRTVVALCVALRFPQRNVWQRLRISERCDVVKAERFPVGAVLLGR